MLQEWDLKPRASACACCNTAFTDRQTYHSALVFGDDGYLRKEYCMPCWAGQPLQNEPYSMWQGVYRTPPPAPEEPLKKETAETLLRTLLESNEPPKTSVIYILAVMLERKRLLIERDVRVRREDGKLIRLYEHRHTGETLMIVDPRLRLDEIEEVQREIVTMLSPPASAPATEPATDAATETPAAE
jgi:hypothetical protein